MLKPPKLLSIIIPAYNEARTIRRIVEKIFQVSFPIDFEVLIVDDSSRDRTYRIVRILHKRDLSQRIRIFRNDKNQGKGFCIRRGFQEARGDVFVIQDADFEYDPGQIPELLAPILEGKTEVVYGSRFMEAQRPEGMAIPNWAANKFLTWVTNIFHGSALTDMETCYKLIRREVVESMELSAKRFDFEPEVTSNILRLGYSIEELPIRYHGRTHEQGKKIKAQDFFIAIVVLFCCRFKKLS